MFTVKYPPFIQITVRECRLISVRRFLPIFLVLGLLPQATVAGFYQQPQAFIAEVFGDSAPPPKLLWLTRSLQTDIREIMNHDFVRLRLRYWQQAEKSAWILEEIGKEKPITVGIVVNSGAVERLKILAFRESRGWEIRHDFFTDQFIGAELAPGPNAEARLDRVVDGISGATLSVRAVKKLATLALYLDRQLTHEQP